MKACWLVLALALLPEPVAAQGPEGAYADSLAERLVSSARQRRGAFDAAIREYRTRSAERITVEHRLARRERLLFRRETAAAIHWQRGARTEITVLGAREVVPVASSKLRIPADLADFIPHIVFDPLDSELLLQLDRNLIRHPLAVDAERDYRYASGDSTVIRLPDGREVRLRELRFTPRRADPQLVNGSLWLHTESNAVVQAVFRIARPYTLRDDAEEGDDVPWFLRNVRADITHVAVEYGLWDLRWWMPRFVAMEGVIELGVLGTMPLRYQRSYDEYEISADAVAPVLPPDSVRTRCRQRLRMSVTVGDTDSTRARRLRDRLRERADTAAEAGDDSGCDQQYLVIVPDSVDLLHGEALPGDIFDDAPLLSELELEQLEARVRSLAAPLLAPRAPRLDWGLGDRGLARYNRVEGLALGVRGSTGLGPLHGSLGVSYGFADEQVSADGQLMLPWRGQELRLEGQRGLRSADPNLKHGALLGSLGALLLGYDEAPYYRAVGASLALAPAPAHSQWYGVRLYAERQSAVRRNTDFSIRHLINEDHTFPANISAAPARQYGADAVLRAAFGQNPAGVRASAQLDVRGETGTFEFARPALTLRAALPPLGPLALGLEAAAGTTAGDAPIQSHWFLGGTQTLRGYPGAVLDGEAFWRGRAELATSLPMARLALFTDLGWAGDARADAWRAAQPLQSLGVGASLLDGIVRIDVARAVRAPTGWRMHLYLDGLL